jgi:hypothetical protein
VKLVALVADWYGYRTDVSDVVSNWMVIPVTKTGSESALLMEATERYRSKTRCISFKSD